MSCVYEQVGLLYHLGMLLRRPAVTRRYIKSVARDEKLSAFAQYDYIHVRGKFRHWQRIAEFDPEETVPTKVGTPSHKCLRPTKDQSRSRLSARTTFAPERVWNAPGNRTN